MESSEDDHRASRLRRAVMPPVFADAERTARGWMVYWMAATIALTTSVSQVALMVLVPGSLPRFATILVVVCGVWSAISSLRIAVASSSPGGSRRWRCGSS